MTKVIELLNKVKTAKNITSDYALAKALDVPNQRICDYYKGNRIPDEYVCLQIAKALGLNYDVISAMVRMEAEKDEKSRNAWREYYKSIGGIAASIALVFFCVVTLIVTPSPAQAAPLLDSGEYAICIMLSYVVGQMGKRICATYARHRISALRFCKLAR